MPKTKKSTTMMKTKMKKRVEFSNISMLACYDNDPTYAETKSITQSDKDFFTQVAVREALRIKALLLRSKESMGGTLQDHLERMGIAEEEVLGLDHLIFESPSHLVARRKLHVRTILLEQEHQQTCMKSDSARLAKVSRVLSKRTRSQARTRAAMAA